MAQGVVAITEQRDGAFRKVSYEVVSEGRRIADALGKELTSVVVGAGIATLAAELKVYGPDRIVVLDNPELAEYRPDAYTNAIDAVVRMLLPAVVVLAATVHGKELSAALAARLGAGLAMDCTAVVLRDGDLICTRPIFGGKLLADVKIQGAPQLIAVRPNAMEITQAPREAAVETIPADLGDVRTTVVEKLMDPGGKTDLTEADIVVSGGRGTGGNFKPIEDLAAALNGVVGASRSAVDEGWRKQSDQVGQTGKTVSPALYIACGISGAVQHLAGISTSKVILAINNDAEAPIFSKVDFGVLGDMFEILPAVTEAVKKLKG